jgi:hypothetical protein
MGGTNKKDNIINLTAKEHYIAHYLLWKIHRNQSMACAFWNMSITRGGKITSSTYERIRIEISLLAKERMSKVEVRDHLRKIFTGHSVSEETRRKISEAGKGRIQDPEVVKRRADANRGKRKGKTFEEIYGIEEAKRLKENLSIKNTGKTYSEETIRKRREKMKGHFVSEETREKISKANRGKVRSEKCRKEMSERNIGKIMTEETRRKISFSLMGKPKSEEHKKKISEARKLIFLENKDV